MTDKEFETIIKLAPTDVGRIQACIELYRKIVPDDKDMEELEERFSDLQYTYQSE